MMAKAQPEMIIGVSLWGQGDKPFLLYAGQPIGSLIKWMRSHKTQVQSENNIWTYFTPAFTWSRRIFNGNLSGIVAANRYNLDQFISRHGMPDILHAQASYPAAWVAKQLSHHYNIPYVVTLRMSPFPFPEFLHNDQLKKDLFEVLRSASQLIATSSSLEQRVRSFGLDHVTTVNNPVDLQFFVPKKGHPKNRNFKLLAVGRLEEQKGFDLLIKALSILPSTIELKIIGGGSQHIILEKLIAELKLEQRISLLGEKSRVHVLEEFHKSDGFVLSSRHETFGNVLLEAMACGLPVVATRCGGPLDIVTNDTGIMCETENVDSLAQAIELLMNSQWDPIKIRKSVAERFSAMTFSQKMMRIYSQCAKTKDKK